MLHRPRLRIDVFRSSVWIGELVMGICQEYGNGFWVAMHHRFFARPIVNTQHADTLVLELDLVMPGINFHWVFSGWLGHSCGCHVSSFGLMKCCRTQKERVRLGLLSQP